MLYTELVYGEIHEILEYIERSAPDEKAVESKS